MTDYDFDSDNRYDDLDFPDPIQDPIEAAIWPAADALEDISGDPWGGFASTVTVKPPGATSWSTPKDAPKVDVIRDAAGSMRLHLRRGFSDGTEIGDAAAAAALDVEPDGWLAARAAVQTGLDAAAGHDVPP